MDKHKDPFYMLEQKEKEIRRLLFSVLTENARLIEENKRLRKEAEKAVSIPTSFLTIKKKKRRKK